MYINKGREKIKRDEYTESNRKNIIFLSQMKILKIILHKKFNSIYLGAPIL